MTVHPCRVCDRESLPNGGRFEADLHLCHDHDLLIRGAFDESARLGNNGFGVGRPTGPKDLDGYAPVACDKCEATWTGQAGSRCYWCLVNHALLLRYQRELALERPEVTDDDARYASEVKRRHGLLVKALEIGLVTKDEAHRHLDVLLRPLEVKS
jgi:hypothetical protein